MNSDKTKNNLFMKLGGVCGFLVGVNLGLFAQVKVSYVNLSEGQIYSPKSIITQQSNPQTSGKTLNIRVYPDVKYQIMKGIGGAFNEQGGEAYMRLSDNKKRELSEALFSVANGAGLTFCRTAIGASDFGLDAYSYSEIPEDYEMKHFSVERDKKSVIPFIQDAIKSNPQLTLFASPWSPPGWMKMSGKMDQGKDMQDKNFLRDEDRVYKAYALYMLKYINAFSKEGINIERLLIQNEQDFHTNYPSCRIPVEQISKYVDGYLAPLFRKEKSSTEIWAGTFRSAGELEFLKFAANKNNRRNFVGMGIQYMRPNYITEIYQLYPDVKLMHTESTCANGANNIKQALGRFDEVANYINGGCDNFCYWNMVLNEEQKSGWGWKQNSLVTVNRNTQEITYHPDYAVFLLLGKFIRPGMQRVACTASGTSMAFVDSNNKLYVFLQNNDKNARKYKYTDGKNNHEVMLPAESLCVLEINM